MCKTDLTRPVTKAQYLNVISPQLAPFIEMVISAQLPEASDIRGRGRGEGETYVNGWSFNQDLYQWDCIKTVTFKHQLRALCT